LLVLEDFELTGAASHITLGSDLNGFLIGLHRAGLLHGCLGELLARNQGVGYFLKGVDNDGMVAPTGFLSQRALLMVTAHQLAPVEDWAGEIAGNAPGVRSAAGEGG